MDGLEDEEGQNVPVSFTEDEIAADIEEGDIDRFDHKAMQPQSNWEADQEGWHSHLYFSIYQCI